MANKTNTQGLYTFMQRFGNKEINLAVNSIVSNLSEAFKQVETETQKELDKIEIDLDLAEKLKKALSKAEKELKGKSLKLSTDLFKNILSTDGSKEAIDNFINSFEQQINSLKKVKISLGDMFDVTDDKVIDDLVKKTEKIEELQSKMDRTTSKSSKTRYANQLKDMQLEYDNLIQSLTQATTALDKYNVEMDVAKKKAVEIAKSQKGNFIVNDKNLNDMKDLIGYLQRYINLGGQLEDIRFDIGGGFMDLSKIFNNKDLDKYFGKYKDDFEELRKSISITSIGEDRTGSGSGIGGSEVDAELLRQQREEVNKLTETLEKTKNNLDEVTQKYKEQSSVVSELENKLKVLEGLNDPKVIESDEYKNITSELENAKKKATEYQNELEKAQKTIEILSSGLQAYNTDDIVPRQDLKNASRVIDNLNNEINTLKTSLTEAEERFRSFFNQVNLLRVDNTSLNEQLSQQKQINEGQKEQISNLEKAKAKYQELLNTIKEVESAQQQAMLLVDNDERIEAFNNATRNVKYNEGIDAPEGFVNFDYLDKAKQKIEETTDKYENLIKAAVYYNQYLEKGGTERIFNADGKDISEQLISVYKEMSNMVKENGEISQESAIEFVRNSADNLRALKDEASQLRERTKELEKQLNLQKQISKQSAQAKPAEKKSTESSNANAMSREKFIQRMQKEQEKRKKQTQGVTSQPEQSPTPKTLDISETPKDLTSEEQTLKRLQDAIKAVQDAINKKTEAIKTEEDQMKTSVDAEIKKLKELESKLTEIKTQFQNGILSKNPDGGDNVTLEKDVDLKPTLDADKFKKNAEGLLAFVDVDKEVELKVGKLDSNNQVIEDVKEQIEAATKNVDLSDSYNPNQFDELLFKDFSTKGKKDATSQLRETYNEFKQYYDDLDKLNTVEGQKAAYNYYKAYEEALKQRISEINLNRYSIDYTEREIAKYYKPDFSDVEIYRSDLDDEINQAERSMKLFSEVQNELGNIKINDSIAEGVSKLASNLNELEKIKSDLDNNVGRASFDDDFNIEYSIENTKREYEECLEIVSHFETILKSEISYAKEFGDTLTQSAQKAESAIADVNDELNKPQQQIQSNKGKTGSRDQDSEKKKTNDDSLRIQLQPEINDEEFLKTLNAIRNKVNPFKLDLDIDNWITVIDNKLTEISGKKVKLDLDATLLPSNNTDNNTTSQEERHAKEVAEAQRKYDEQLLAEKKQREKEYTAWWTNELNNRDQIQKQLQAEEERNQKELQKQLEREQAESNKAQIQKYKDFIKEDDSEKTIKQSQEYAKLESVVEQYGEIRKNIAKNNGKATDEEIAKLNELEDKINSISKNISEQGLYSSGKDKSIAKTLLSYDDRDEKIRQQSSINSVDNSNNLKRVNQLLEEQREIQRQINALQNKEQSDGLSTGDQEVLNSLSRNYLDIQERINNELDKQYPKTKRITDVLSKITTNNVDFENIRTLNFDDDINFDKSVENVNKFGAEIDNIRNKLENLSNANTNAIFQGEFQNASNNISELTNEFLNSKLQLSDFNKYSKETEKILNNLGKRKDVAGVFEAGNLQAAQDMMVNHIKEIDAVDASTIKWNSNGQKLTATFKDANGELRELILNARLADGQFDQTFGKPVKQVSTWSKFIDELGVKFRNLGTYLLSFVGFYEVWGAIQQGVTYVRELDTALTEMRKVSDETVESLRDFQKVSFDIANNVGTTAVQIQNSTADWMRLGESIEEATKSAQVSNILLNVSEFEDISTATDALVSVSQAYEDFEKIDIVDKMNNIGKILPKHMETYGVYYI